MESCYQDEYRSEEKDRLEDEAFERFQKLIETQLLEYERLVAVMQIAAEKFENYDFTEKLNDILIGEI